MWKATIPVSVAVPPPPKPLLKNTARVHIRPFASTYLGEVMTKADACKGKAAPLNGSALATALDIRAMGGRLKTPKLKG